MKKIIAVAVLIIVVAIIISSVGSCSVCSNQTHRTWFNEDGAAVRDSELTSNDTFLIENPAKVHFYLESSGSMNGFLRGGVPTDFKKDVWEVINSYSSTTDGISVLTSDGDSTKSLILSLADFQNPFDGGGFVCGKSTKLCQMIRSIIENIHPNRNEVSVFISDMEYDPVGAVAPSVLKSVYATDIAAILSNFGYSISIVAATSNSKDINGNIQTNKRPYYYLILGKANCVASVRNCISQILNENRHFIDNIETGFSYGKVPYSIVSYSGCTQIGKNPSFAGISNSGCSFVLGIELNNYRSLLAMNPEILKKSIHIESKNGATVKIDSISYESEDGTGKDSKHAVLAKVYISITQMPYDCDVLEWNLEVPFKDDSKFQQLYTDTPNSLEQTYSIKEFITGMFQSRLTCNNGKENYIHIAK